MHCVSTMWRLCPPSLFKLAQLNSLSVRYTSSYMFYSSFSTLLLFVGGFFFKKKQIGVATSFSPTVITYVTNATVFSVTGLGLSTTSVRAVRFEPASSCTSATVGATSGTIVGGPVATSGTLSQVVTTSQTAYFAPGSYAVCIDYNANPLTGGYLKVGSILLGVGFVFFSPTRLSSSLDNAASFMCHVQAQYLRSLRWSSLFLLPHQFWLSLLL